VFETFLRPELTAGMRALGDRPYLRFRLNPDEQVNGDGAYIDDVSIHCSGVYSADSFQYLSGTSMATPHVTGVAA
jgi:subtilisin family serine protease